MKNLAARLSRLETALQAELNAATARLTQEIRAELQAILADIEARKARGEPPPPATPETIAITRELRELLADVLNRTPVTERATRHTVADGCGSEPRP
jgi:hypothetical protein